MSYDRATLVDLRERVQTAGLSDGSPILNSLHGTAMHGDVPDVTGSLDAAMALVEHALPGKLIEISNKYQGFWRAQVGLTSSKQMRTAPLVLLDAMLSALIEQSTPETEVGR